MEFLVQIEIHRPSRATDAEAEALAAAEKIRGAELVAEGTLRRVWRVPGQWANWGLWEAPDPTTLHAAISTLPLWKWMKVQVHPLARHALDPGQVP